MKQRHSAKHLFWRGVVAAVGNTAMSVGVYPVLPHVGVHIARKRRGLPMPPSQLRAVTREWATAVAMSAILSLVRIGPP